MQSFIRGVELSPSRCGQERIRRHSFKWLLHPPAIRLLNTMLSIHFLPDTSVSADEQKHILGGEATMWSECILPVRLLIPVLAGTAAIAERLWSPRSVRDVDDMYRRLAVISLQLEELGLTHERNVDVLLRRMAGNQEIAPLKLLVLKFSVEPVKEYHRGQQRPATMLTPLTGLVYAAKPDSAASRQFARVVDGFLTDAPRFQLNASFLRLTLTEWRDAEPSLSRSH